MAINLTNSYSGVQDYLNYTLHMSAYQRLLQYEVTQTFTGSHNKNAEAQEKKIFYTSKCFILNPQFCQRC
jgi:hypothetical protein